MNGKEFPEHIILEDILQLKIMSQTVMSHLQIFPWRMMLAITMPVK